MDRLLGSEGDYTTEFNRLERSRALEVFPMCTRGIDAFRGQAFEGQGFDYLNKRWRLRCRNDDRLRGTGAPGDGALRHGPTGGMNFGRGLDLSLACIRFHCSIFYRLNLSDLGNGLRRQAITR